MRGATRAITTLSALVFALACGGGGGGGGGSIVITNAFPQGFLPQRLAGSTGSGDVAFRFEGDLFAVGGGTSDVTTIARADGAVSTFANDVGGAGNSLLSIAAGTGTDSRLFAGDTTGRIWAIATDGTASLLIDTGSEPITGLAIAPPGFGNLEGSLFAAAGDAGILRITLGDTPAVSTFADPGERYVDVVFSGTTLFALDATDDEVDTIAPDGAATTLQGGFDAPVGLAVDSAGGEIYVADAGDDVLRSLPVAGGTVTDRAEYDFDLDAPSGVAYDGIGAIAFVTNAPFAVRGSALPRIDPANSNLGLDFVGPTIGFGDLEFDRLGTFVFTANDPDDPLVAGDSTNNFLFNVSRDGVAVTVIASAVGAPGEDLTGVAIDPISQTIYFASRLGNIYRRLAADGSVSLLVNVSASPVLGLELAPALPSGQGFDPFNGQLIATTADGHVFAIDPESPTPPTRITAGPIGTHLVDAVFSSAGLLYVVDNDETTARILRVTSSGAATNLQASTTLLGRADGIEIDEGANRLLVTTDKSPDQLLAVSLAGIPAAVTGLANIDINDGFFPTGVVYDRLGTAVVHAGEIATALVPIDVSP
jgi:DNA-binding beta-propeller fold protein YncE